ncbi:UNVERIFIED_CONTAM: hypothetical protein Scaly_1641200 [Sesamum calycinum]|uniref:DUF3456 domain-containing protein n=1 Tax=Sesamum calycinum TaxID=2727403 RepID=A0AAW2PBJ2_9LAMI
MWWSSTMAKLNLPTVLVMVIVIFAVSAYGIDDKCAACNAIAVSVFLLLLFNYSVFHILGRAGARTLECTKSFKLNNSSNLKTAKCWFEFQDIVLLVTKLCPVMLNGIVFQWFSEKPRNHLDMRHRLDSKGQREGKLIDYRVSELRVVELLDGLCDNMQDYTLEKVDSSRRVWIKVNSWDNLKTSKQEARAYSKDISTFCGRLLEETEDELSELIKKGSVKVGEVSKVLCQDLGRYCSKTSGNRKAVDDEDTSDREL